MPGNPTTVKQYLSKLPADRRDALEQVRKVILENLPEGYEEGIQYGMIGYYVPHSIYPAGYHAKPEEPLPFASIASQKNHMGLYLMCVYMESDLQDWFVKSWKASGKKLDMGKSCVRFKKIEDVPLDVVGKVIKKVPVKKFIKAYEAGIGTRASSARKKPTKKSAR